MATERSANFVILCNGAKLTSRARQWTTCTPVELDSGKSATVRLKIQDIYEKLGSNLTDRAADLLEIATFVYIADQHCKRSGWKAVDYGDHWYRELRFEIAVRDPDFWQQAAVVDLLCQTLHFLSADNYDFKFCKNKEPADVGDYLDFRAANPNPEGIDRVVMFSGGLDSLAGAIDSIFNDSKRVLLVSHASAPHTKSLQEKLVNQLKDRCTSGTRFAPTHVPVWVNKRGEKEVEPTQRSRSFLYVALGAIVADLHDIDCVDFYENGIVSVNLPLADHAVGGRSTRTTHPQTLRRFSDLLSKVLGTPFRVRNSFFDRTKQDVVELIERSGHGDLIRQSVSCTHTRKTSHSTSHCGLCSQCLSRRFATLGLRDSSLDPSDLYRIDVLTGKRTSSEQRTLAEGFVGLAQSISRMRNAAEFQRAFAAELGRITKHMDGRSTENIEQIFDLHSRHASQVGQVLTEAIARHADAVWDGTLPESCPVAMVRSIGAGHDTQSPTPSAPRTDGGRFVPSPRQLDVLRLLASSKSLKTRTQLEADSGPAGCRISRRTLSPILQDFHGMGLVSYPQGERKGVAITEAGRQLLNDASH